MEKQSVTPLLKYKESEELPDKELDKDPAELISAKRLSEVIIKERKEILCRLTEARARQKNKNLNLELQKYEQFFFQLHENAMNNLKLAAEKEIKCVCNQYNTNVKKRMKEYDEGDPLRPLSDAVEILKNLVENLYNKRHSDVEYFIDLHKKNALRFSEIEEEFGRKICELRKAQEKLQQQFEARVVVKEQELKKNADELKANFSIQSEGNLNEEKEKKDLMEENSSSQRQVHCEEDLIKKLEMCSEIDQKNFEKASEKYNELKQKCEMELKNLIDHLKIASESLSSEFNDLKEKLEKPEAL